MPPKTRYARSGRVSIAYQVIGDGPLDLVFIPGFVSNGEYYWEMPGMVRALGVSPPSPVSSCGTSGAPGYPIRRARPDAG